MTKITDLEKHVGSLIRNFPNKHDIEYKHGFSIQMVTFFQKLVSQSLLEKGVRITSADYMKGLLFLDYFSEIIDDNYYVCDSLVILSKALREQEKARGNAEKGKASYLNLEAVILEVGLYAKEKEIGHAGYYSAKENVAKIKQRFNSDPSVVDLSSSSAKHADPYYEGIGLMVADLFSAEGKKYLPVIGSRAQLSALVFCDCVYNLIKNKDYKKIIFERVGNGDYLSGSLVALEGLIKESTKRDMLAFIIPYEGDKHGFKN